MTISILPSAMIDLAEGFRFYEQQEKELGIYFLDSLYSDIDSLKLYGGIHRKVFGHYRLLSKRFPFMIYYTMQGEQVLDCRRDPKRIRQKLR
jgi:hypothetical protein